MTMALWVCLRHAKGEHQFPTAGNPPTGLDSPMTDYQLPITNTL
ncbi:hypothetical protein [Nostoc sp. MS1]|nr:hypothetical protein [Nostoc sp. MS1]